jgi:hypothetical protein
MSTAISTANATLNPAPQYDVFIFHATEDKDTFVRPLPADPRMPKSR